MSQNADQNYTVGSTHPNRKPYATFETKPSHPDYTGGGYEHWRSAERRPHTARQGAEDVYASHHRLLAVVECYPAEKPIDEILDHMHGRDIHHNAPEVEEDLGIPWDNRPDAIEVVGHREHSMITQAEQRAWGEDAKKQAEEAQDAPLTIDDELCPGCGREVDTPATSAGFDGRRCIECAKRECDGEAIELGGGA